LPTPQPDPKLEAHVDERLTAVEVLNPSMLLMQVRESIKVLLSRNTIVEPHGIHLRGVRLIEIPLGWRLLLVRFLSRFWKVRFPDEIEFGELLIDTTKSPSRAYANRAIVGEVEDPGALIQLTGSEYFALCGMNGRRLHRWVVDRFEIKSRNAKLLPARRRKVA
jgi:hypothetical protein